MKLVMTLLVRDEDDVLEANILYHLNQGVDFIVATDNNSTDATPEILERYRRKGVLHVIREESDVWDQPEWVVRMARMAATEFGADWVINNDADEFWWPRVATLKDIFATVPERYSAVIAPRLNFIPRPIEEDPFWQRMTVVELQALKWRAGGARRGPLFSKQAHRATADVRVNEGEGRRRPPQSPRGNTQFRPVPGWRPIFIFHYPMRSFSQFERKVAIPETALEGDRFNDRSNLFQLHREGGLRQFYYEQRALSDEAVEAGVDAGELCIDTRIQRFMSDLEGQGTSISSGAVPPRLDPEDLTLDMLWAADKDRLRRRGEKKRAARQGSDEGGLLRRLRRRRASARSG